MHLVEQFFGTADALLIIHEQTIAGFLPQEHVFCRADPRHQRKFLVDNADSLLLGQDRGHGLEGFAADGDRAAVRLDSTGQHLDKGGFSGAVFTDQGMNFTLPHIKGDMVDCHNAGVGFYNIPNTQDVGV